MREALLLALGLSAWLVMLVALSIAVGLAIHALARVALGWFHSLHAWFMHDHPDHAWSRIIFMRE